MPKTKASEQHEPGIEEREKPRKLKRFDASVKTTAVDPLPIPKTSLQARPAGTWLLDIN